MTWSALMDFITTRDASLAASLRGVPPADIRSIEARYAIALPANYVEFLRTMGEDSGTIEPFGETRMHTFSTLVARLPPRGYPGHRFFKIAFESDALAIDHIDIYLDLARSNGGDAPLVSFEAPLAADGSGWTDEPLTFVETLTERLFLILDVERQMYGARVFVFSGEPWNGATTKAHVMRVLTAAGFGPALPELDRVVCLTRGGIRVLLTVSDTSEVVDLRLGGDDRDALDAVLQDVMDLVPDVEIEEPLARRTAGAGS